MKDKAKYLFGDIVVVNGNEIGVVVKTWEIYGVGYYYEVYNRMTRTIEDYKEPSVERYRVRHKELDEQELEWQNN